jgi:hypothetical protein
VLANSFFEYHFASNIFSRILVLVVGALRADIWLFFGSYLWCQLSEAKRVVHPAAGTDDYRTFLLKIQKVRDQVYGALCLHLSTFFIQCPTLLDSLESFAASVFISAKQSKGSGNPGWIKSYQSPFPLKIFLLISHICSLIMAFSMHSHSGQFCPSHAKDSLEEIIQTAISRGMQTFALTEHMPRDSDDDMYPDEVYLLYPLSFFTNTELDINRAPPASP